MRLVRQSCQGAAAARNTAYAHCRGDFIQWLDADDLLAPDKIAAQVEVLTRSSNRRTLAAAAWEHFLHRTRRAAFHATALWNDLTPTEWLLRKMRDNLHMQTATWLVSRELSEAAGRWDTRLSFDDDGEYFCRVLLASEGVMFVSDAKVYYRMSGRRRLSHIGCSRRKLESLMLSMQLHRNYLLSREDSARTREACSNYFQNWLSHFCYADPDLLAQFQRLAAGNGITLEPPSFSWKYEWLGKFFGWRVASRVQFDLPRWKWLLVAAWDKALFHLERRGSSITTEF